ncbi:hypothetical protein HN615_14890 [Candidatus Woesearchaeota archaeon]|jgi:hypothetical protein|nr:hypothetical protein [Candidatus Woesearchaeota archaeon]
MKRVTVTNENDSGRNLRFHDNYNGKNMSRAEFVKEIEQDHYENYHVRKINGLKTPVSNPDGKENNNLD